LSHIFCKKAAMLLTPIGRQILVDFPMPILADDFDVESLFRLAVVVHDERDRDKIVARLAGKSIIAMAVGAVLQLNNLQEFDRERVTFDSLNLNRNAFVSLVMDVDHAERVFLYRLRNFAFDLREKWLSARQNYK